MSTDRIGAYKTPAENSRLFYYLVSGDRTELPIWDFKTNIFENGMVNKKSYILEISVLISYFS